MCFSKNVCALMLGDRFLPSQESQARAIESREWGDGQSGLSALQIAHLLKIC